MAEPDTNQAKTRDLTAEMNRQPLPTSILATRSGRLLLGLCLLQFVPLVWVALRSSQPPSPKTAPASAIRSNAADAADAASSDVFSHGKPGPWGNLEYVRITIEPLDEFVPADDRIFEKTRWVFGGHTREQVAALFNACDLTPGQRAELLNPAALRRSTAGCRSCEPWWFWI